MPVPNDDPGKSPETKTLTIKLEDGTEKTVDAAYVTNLIKQQASATQKTQKVAPLMKLCEKYEADPSQVADQADKAFQKILEARKEGYLDEHYNWVKPKAATPQNDPGNSGIPNQDPVPRNTNMDTYRTDKLEAIVQKVFSDTVGKRIDALENVASRMTDMQLSGKIREKYPDLDEQSVARVFYLSRSDNSKNFWQHADDVHKDHQSRMDKAFEERAQKMGIDLQAIKQRNELKEQGAGGGMLPMFKGKKISLFPKKDAVTASDAMVEHFKAKDAAHGG